MNLRRILDLKRDHDRLLAENDLLRRRVEALHRERDWEAGWLTAKCEEMQALIERWGKP